MYKLLACFSLLLTLSGAETATTPSTPDAGVEWMESYDSAFASAQARDTIVFLAVNMDGETANDEAAKKLYTHKLILPLTTETVNLVASQFEHATSGNCPRFGSHPCSDHQKVDIKARAQILKPGPSGSVIAPHHVFLDKNGVILLSVAYKVSAKELAWCFRAAQKKAYPDGDFPAIKGARAPSRLVMDGVVNMGDSGIRPLTKEEMEATIKRIRSSKRFDQRIEDLYSLIATDHPDAVEVVARDLKNANAAAAYGGRGRGGGGGGGGKEAEERFQNGRAKLIHRIGVFSPPSYWEAIVTQLGDASVMIRQEAAVALEQLGNEDAVKELKAALKKEENADVRRCLVRALGTCGVDSSSARKQLSTIAKSKKDEALRRNALFALGGQVDQKGVTKILASTLETGTAQQQQAVLLGIGFARNASLLPLLDSLKASEAKLDPSTQEALSAVMAVMEGENLLLLKDKAGILLGDTLEREKYFGTSKK